MNPNLIIIKERYINELINSSFSMSDDDKYLEIQNLVIEDETYESVRFSDVDYDCKAPGEWKVISHLNHVKDLAIIYYRNNVALKEKSLFLLIRALKHWLIHDYLCPNWWHNEINTPWVLSDIAILIIDKCSQEEKDKIDSIIKRGSLKYNEDSKKWTGANQLWCTNNSTKHAILLDDSEYMKMIADRMYSEIAYGKEGIQKDGSFFQHGPRLYSGGYGRSFIFSLINMICKFDGTSFGLPNEKVNILENFILDGLRWMIHKEQFDWACCGREFCRFDWGNAGMIASVLELLTKFSSIKRKQELLDFIEEIRNNKQTLVGIKYFPVCDMLCTHINGLYFGFKGISPRTVSGEVCNSEGVLCYNTTYGTTTCVMKTGKEYFEIAPLWNWCRIPGTTTIDECDDILIQEDHATKCNQFQKGEGFDGGMIEDCAWEYQEVEHLGTSASVICFATPWGIVLLGNSLKTTSNLPLVTTLEQCFYTGNFQANDTFVVHNGVRYESLDQLILTTKIDHRIGSWNRVNKGMDNILSEGDIIEITISPKDSYAYSIQPEETNEHFHVVTNDNESQSIRLPDGRVFIHFSSNVSVCIDGKIISGNNHEALII